MHSQFIFAGQRKQYTQRQEKLTFKMKDFVLWFRMKKPYSTLTCFLALTYQCTIVENLLSNTSLASVVIPHHC